MFLEKYGLTILIILAVLIWIWVARNIIAAVKEARVKYKYPVKLVEEIEERVISEVFIDGQLGDGFHVRNVIVNAVTSYADEYPEVDYHASAIYQYLDAIDLSSLSEYAGRS